MRAPSKKGRAMDSKNKYRDHSYFTGDDRQFLERLAGELVFAAMAAVMFALVVVFTALAFVI